MNKAILCPVCNGSGKFYIPPISGGSSSIGTSKTCHGCEGKGWVVIEEGK